MISKYKKMIVACVVLSLFILIGLSGVPIRHAEAETFEERIPTFGLYCEDSEIIKNGTVNFDLTDTELLSKGLGVKQAEYQVAAAHREVEFAIPFVSSAMNLSPISVTVNGQKVEGSVWYGYSGYWHDYDFDINKTYSPVLDESITGTLYTFIPDNDTVTVSLKLNEWKSYIYETTNHYSSSRSVDGSHTWDLKNASSAHEYSFFIFGDAEGCSFESSCGYRTETITCQEFIDNQYKKYEEYYDHNGGVPIELFYSIVNRVLKDNTTISYDELFFRSIDTHRVNAYKFRIQLETDAVISYETQISVNRNYAFKPVIYKVEQKQAAYCTTNYIIELNNEIPYIIESSIEAQKHDKNYIAETTEDFYFVFSASEKPQSINGDNNKTETWQIVLFVLLGVFACALIVSLTMLIIYSFKYKKARKGNK